MNSLKSFFVGLVLLFAAPWLILIIYPWVSLAGLDRMQYGEETEAEATYYPPIRTGLQLGAQVYGRNGCAYCHTQMIRPTYAGADRWRTGWAGRDENTARETRPRDYLSEKFAYLGVVRIGPDLSNVGYRQPDEAWHYQHLFDPRSVRPGSVMPSFRNLFQKRRIIGQRSNEAVATVVEDGLAYEYVPGPEAEALVLYLLSLRKDQPLPAKLVSKK